MSEAGDADDPRAGVRLISEEGGVPEEASVCHGVAATRRFSR